VASTPEVRKTKRKFVRPQLTDYGKLDAITMQSGNHGQILVHGTGHGNNNSMWG